MSGPLFPSRVVVELGDEGALWRAPSCPICQRTMVMHRSAFVVDSMPTYLCETHGNEGMAFVFDISPASGSALNDVIAVDASALVLLREDGTTQRVEETA